MGDLGSLEKDDLPHSSPPQVPLGRRQENKLQVRAGMREALRRIVMNVVSLNGCLKCQQ